MESWTWYFWTFVACEWIIRIVMLVYVPHRRSAAAARSWLLLILAGFTLAPRLPVYPEYIARPQIGYAQDNYGKGVYGGTAIVLSDLVGNRRLALAGSINGRIEEAQVFAAYQSLANRFQYTVGVQQSPTFFLLGSTLAYTLWALFFLNLALGGGRQLAPDCISGFSVGPAPSLAPLLLDQLGPCLRYCRACREHHGGRRRDDLVRLPRVPHSVSTSSMSKPSIGASGRSIGPGMSTMSVSSTSAGGGNSPIIPNPCRRMIPIRSRIMPFRFIISSFQVFCCSGVRRARTAIMWSTRANFISVSVEEMSRIVFSIAERSGLSAWSSCATPVRSTG